MFGKCTCKTDFFNERVASTASNSVRNTDFILIVSALHPAYRRQSRQGVQLNHIHRVRQGISMCYRMAAVHPY